MVQWFQDDGLCPISLEPKESGHFQNIIWIQNWVYLHIWTGFDQEMLKKTTYGPYSYIFNWHSQMEMTNIIINCSLLIFLILFIIIIYIANAFDFTTFNLLPIFLGRHSLMADLIRPFDIVEKVIVPFFTSFINWSKSFHFFSSLLLASHILGPNNT